jgi:hypothetical protein
MHHRTGWGSLHHHPVRWGQLSYFWGVTYLMSYHHRSLSSTSRILLGSLACFLVYILHSAVFFGASLGRGFLAIIYGFYGVFLYFTDVPNIMNWNQEMGLYTVGATVFIVLTVLGWVKRRYLWGQILAAVSPVVVSYLGLYAFANV